MNLSPARRPHEGMGPHKRSHPRLLATQPGAWSINDCRQYNWLGHLLSRSRVTGFARSRVTCKSMRLSAHSTHSELRTAHTAHRAHSAHSALRTSCAHYPGLCTHWVTQGRPGTPKWPPCQTCTHTMRGSICTHTTRGSMCMHTM